jgi:5-methylthioribose kinase
MLSRSVQIEVESTVIELHEHEQPPGRGYRALTADTVVDYLGTRAAALRRLGGAPATWRADERGDGNLNLVFVVKGPAGALVVKQALPYVRMVGPSWPLSLSRSGFELSALVEQARWGAAFVPEVYDSDEAMALIVMEYLASHQVLRRELIAGRRHPLVGQHVGQFLASVLFHTSDLHLSAGEKRRRSGQYLGNIAMCKISEDLIFDEPYFAAPMNRHTAPALNSAAAALRQDLELKLAAQEMKWRFLNQPECLVHGDLHTGSVMVNAQDTRMIDPEFAFYGPMGFDIGLFIAHLLIAFMARAGREPVLHERHAQREYLLRQIMQLWQTFAEGFAQNWRRRAAGPSQSNLYNARLFVDSPALNTRAFERRLAEVWDQALGFAGCEIIRRIVGLSHVEDFEGIEDPDVRASCERNAIALARDLLLRRAGFATVDTLSAAAWAYA